MTVTAIEPQSKKKKRRAVPVPPGIPASGLGQPSDGYCFATHDLAEVLEPEIEKLNAELERTAHPNSGNFRQTGFGAVEQIGGYAAARMNLEHGVARRLYSVRTGEVRAIGSEWAAYFFFAVGKNVDQCETIPVLPGGIKAAREMVDCHFEFNSDEEPDELAKERLARMLHGFTKGYLAGVNADITTDTEEWARYVSGFLLDQHNRRYPTKRVMRREQESDAA